MSDADDPSPWSPQFEAQGGSSSIPDGRAVLDHRSDEPGEAPGRTNGALPSRRFLSRRWVVAILVVLTFGFGGFAIRLAATANETAAPESEAPALEAVPSNTVPTTLVEVSDPVDDVIAVPVFTDRQEDSLVVIGVTSLGSLGLPNMSVGEPEVGSDSSSPGVEWGPVVVSLDDRTVVVTATGNAFQVSPGSESVELDQGIAGPVFGELNSEFVWYVQPAGDGIEILKLQFGRQGLTPTNDGAARTERSERRITEYPDAVVLGNDGNGNVVLRNTGGVYIVGDAPPVRLTTGTLLAIGPDTAFVRECDENLECINVVIDRTTGDRTELSLEFSLLPMEPRLGLGALPTISVGGRQAIVRTSSQIGGEAGWRLFDFERVTSAAVAPPDSSSPILWGDTGSTAAWLSDSTLNVWTYSAEADSNEAVSVAGIPKLSAITIEE